MGRRMVGEDDLDTTVLNKWKMGKREIIIAEIKNYQRMDWSFHSIDIFKRTKFILDLREKSVRERLLLISVD